MEEGQGSGGQSTPPNEGDTPSNQSPLSEGSVFSIDPEIINRVDRFLETFEATPNLSTGEVSESRRAQIEFPTIANQDRERIRQDGSVLVLTKGLDAVGGFFNAAESVESPTRDIADQFRTALIEGGAKMLAYCALGLTEGTEVDDSLWNDRFEAETNHLENLLKIRSALFGTNNPIYRTQGKSDANDLCYTIEYAHTLTPEKRDEYLEMKARERIRRFLDLKDEDEISPALLDEGVIMEEEYLIGAIGDNERSQGKKDMSYIDTPHYDVENEPGYQDDAPDPRAEDQT